MQLLGKRAKLELLREEHALPLYEIICKNSGLWDYMVIEMSCLDDMKTMIEECLLGYKKGTIIPFAVIDQTTNEIVGSTRLYNIQIKERTTELGHTFYSPNVQRTGINTECKYMLLKYAFEELNLIRVQLKTDLRNLRSQKAIERIGATKEGILRNERELYTGYIRDAVVYSIIHQEWETIKDRLHYLMNKYDV